jgi:hypothetical protein
MTHDETSDELSDYVAFNDPDHGMIVAAADRLRVMPADLLKCVQAVSITRRGSTEWSEHDLLITESCIGTFTKAVIARDHRRSTHN